MITEETKLSLVTIAEGAAVERFDDALSGVIENMMDPNAADGVRKITLEVHFKPNVDRTMTEIVVKCEAKNQPPAKVSSTAYMGVTEHGYEAFEIRKKQIKLPFATTAPQNVVAMKKGGES